MNKIRRLIPLLLLMLLGNNIYAQQMMPGAQGANGSNTGSTASAGSIYNVSLYDGTASVRIPIYAYSVDGLDLGVALNYNTKGIQLDQTAGMCGLGWSLDPDYCITRQVNGTPDEMLFPPVHDKPNTPNGYGGYFDSTDYAIPPMSGTWSVQASGYEDHSNMDIFYLSLPGRNYRFCNQAKGGGFKVYPKSELNIVEGGLANNPNIDARIDTGKFMTFTVHDEKGNQYTFDRIDYETRWQSSPNGRDNYPYHLTSKWLLTKVATNTGQVILYHYKTVYNISYPQYREQKVLEEQDHVEQAYTPDLNQHYNASIKVLVDSNVIWNGTISYLTDIVYPNGTTVYFNYETDTTKPRCDVKGTQVLKSVKVQSGYDANTTNSLTYSFNYAYFHTPVIGASASELPYGTACSNIGIFQNAQLALRLKLKSIDKTGTDNVTKEQYYSFDYNSTPLQSRLTSCKDYYGYYNGQSSQYSHSGGNIDSGDLSNLCIPYHSFVMTGGGATYNYGVSRDPVLQYMQACNLIKVTNGMGGSVDFYYKMHQLYNPDNAYNDASYASNRAMDQDGQNAPDGLCIDSVVVKDGYNTDNATSIKYVFDHGERFFRGGYLWEPKYAEDTNVYARYCYNDFINPMQFINGSNHGYSFATVKNYGAANQFLGATKYHFSNLMKEADTNVSNLKIKSYFSYNSIKHVKTFYHRIHPDSMAEYNMGQLLESYSYDRNWDLVSQQQHTYAGSGTDFIYSVPVELEEPVYNDGTKFADRPFDNYYPFLIKKSLEKTQTNTVYSNGQSSTTTLTNEFNTDDNIIKVSWQDSKGDTYHKNYGFSGNFLTSSNIIKDDGNGGVFVDAHSSNVTPYSNFHSLKATAPVPVNVMNASLTTQDKDHLFDNHINPVQTNYDGTVHYDAAIWDTRIGQKVADVTNAQYTQVAYTSFEGAFGPIGNTDNKGNWDFDPATVEYVAPSSGSNAMTGHYVCHLSPSKTISSVYPPDASDYKLTFWGYGGLKASLGSTALQLTQVDNVGGWALYTASFTGNGSDNLSITGLLSNAHIDELRLCPAAASMSTRTYEPLLGTGSTCNERNDILYYEYDAMGRVKTVRDIEHHIISLTKQTVQGGDY